MSEIDVDLLEMEMKKDRTGFQNFRSIFPGVKEHLKNDDLDSIDRIIR